MSELPKNLIKEHCEFTGWYTSENGGGKQVADKYGLIPLVSVLNETNFDISKEYINLYAGFEAEKYAVTCHFGTAAEAEMVQVEYDTPVSRIVTETRVNGKAPLTWKTQDGQIFNGKITESCDLYAVEYAPVIEFDSNGGSKVAPVVARAGSSVSLPVPEKDLAKFSHWEDMQGNRYENTAMPGNSISLKAVWQAKLVFDENGGGEVNDISYAAGETITLPVPEKEGYIFAGWYTADKEQYTTTKMPANGIALKAGWFEEKSETKVLIASTTRIDSLSRVANFNDDLNFNINLTKYNISDFKVSIRINWHFNIRYNLNATEMTAPAYLEIYNKKIISSNYLVEKRIFNEVNRAYTKYEFTSEYNDYDNLYISFYGDSNLYRGDLLYISDFYITIFYPDTSNLTYKFYNKIKREVGRTSL